MDQMKTLPVGRSIEKARTGKTDSAQGVWKSCTTFRDQCIAREPAVGPGAYRARWFRTEEQHSMMTAATHAPRQDFPFHIYFRLYHVLLPFVCFALYHCRKSPQNGIGSTWYETSHQASSRRLSAITTYFLKLPARRTWHLRHASP